MWKTASVFRVDVARDVAHGGGDIGVGLEQLLDLADGAEHGRVVAAAELLADLLEGEIVRLRMRYMAIWRAMAVFLLRLCPRRSAPLSWNERADSSIMTSGVGMYVPVRMTSLMARLTESTVIVSSRMSR